jgi:hypothetical protein
LQQQHVDHKIANALLKKGTLDIYKTWHQHDRAWVDMRLHESHDDGGFGVSNNTITRLAASYTTNARFVAFLLALSVKVNSIVPLLTVNESDLFYCISLSHR